MPLRTPSRTAPQEILLPEIERNSLYMPPTCPYYVHHPGGSFDAFLHAKKCINFDFVVIDDEAVTICLVIPGHTPDCATCLAKKEGEPLQLSNLSSPESQDKSKVPLPEREPKNSSRTLGGDSHN